MGLVVGMNPDLRPMRWSFLVRIGAEQLQHYTSVVLQFLECLYVSPRRDSTRQAGHVSGVL